MMENTNHMIHQSQKWTTVIQSKNAWNGLDLKELWRYRDLVELFVRRDFVAMYKQTVLGPLWFLIQPLLSSMVYAIIFGEIAKIPTDGIPGLLFYLSGLIIWNYFSACLTQTSDSFVKNAAIFGKVYFPRLVMPIVVVIANLFSFLIQFVLFICFLGFYWLQGFPVQLNWLMLLLPLQLAVIAAFGLGIGLMVTSLTIKYRDLTFLVSLLMQLWMYASPVVYPISQVPESWRFVYSLNPVAVSIELFRAAFLGQGHIDPLVIILDVILVGIILIVGLLLFGRAEKSFLDTV